MMDDQNVECGYQNLQNHDSLLNFWTRVSFHTRNVLTSRFLVGRSTKLQQVYTIMIPLLSKSDGNYTWSHRLEKRKLHNIFSIVDVMVWIGTDTQKHALFGAFSYSRVLGAPFMVDPLPLAPWLQPVVFLSVLKYIMGVGTFCSRQNAPTIDSLVTVQ